MLFRWREGANNANKFGVPLKDGLNFVAPLSTASPKLGGLVSGSSHDAVVRVQLGGREAAHATNVALVVLQLAAQLVRHAGEDKPGPSQENQSLQVQHRPAETEETRSEDESFRALLYQLRKSWNDGDIPPMT